MADVLRSHRSALRGLAERLAKCETQADESLDVTAGELARLGARLDAFDVRLAAVEARLAALDGGGADLAGLMVE